MDVGVDQLEMLQKLGKYRAATTKLKYSAAFGIFFGLMAVVAVLSGGDRFPTNALDAVLLAIGVVIFVVSLWQLSNPSLWGLLAEGMLIIGLGAWNIIVGVLPGARGAEDAVASVMMGLIQIGVGLHELRKYSLLRKDFPEEPSRESIRFVDELVKGLLARKRKKDDDLVEFQSKPFIGQARHWKGVLLGDAAILVTKQRDVIAARKQGISLKLGRKLTLQKAYNVTLRVGDVKHKGTMPKWSVERFEAWKAAPAAEQVAGADTVGITDEGGSAHSDSVPSVLR